MKETYQLNSANTFHSLKYLKRNLMMLPFMMLLSIPMAYYVKGYTWLEAVRIAPFINLTAFLFLGCIPTFLILARHYFSSKNLVVSIDKSTNQIMIMNGESHIYDFDKLHITEHLALSKKKNEDGKFRLITPWSNFSYLNIKTADNKEFNISSNILNSEMLPLAEVQKQYSLWPAMKRVH